MALASTGKAIVNGKAFRIYKAGTGTFICKFKYLIIRSQEECQVEES